MGLNSRRTTSIIVGVAVAVTLLLPGSAWRTVAFVHAAQAPDWPTVTRDARPWTRWWWMGSAVDEAGLTAELEALRAAGVGGVEITPIYGAAGAESRFVPYLSTDWVRLLEHTLAEADRLGIGVDMATGTGWPFGGPWVGERDACRALVYRTWTIEGGQRLAERVRLEQTPLLRAVGNQIYEVQEVGRGEPPPQGTREQPVIRPGGRGLQIADLVEPVEANQNLQALALDQVRYPKSLPLLALVAHSNTGTIVDLTTRVAPDSGSAGVPAGGPPAGGAGVKPGSTGVPAGGTGGILDWTAPAGTWTLYGVFLGWHGKLVERAAPGGEGNVIDHFSRDAIRNYLARFDKAFASGTGRRGGRPLRAFFNDSYEVDDASGQATGTPALFEEFQRRRGYDLRQHLPALLSGPPDKSASGFDPDLVHHSSLHSAWSPISGSGRSLRLQLANRHGLQASGVQAPDVFPKPEARSLKPDDTSARVLADYRETISDLLLETFTAEWRTWANGRGSMVRNQAHGSPASLLDLYAASDIPETEGTEIRRFKWATSAAHVAGRPLVSAEAATWLGEHFRSTLGDVRGALDKFFIAGVNHVVYHGTAYSPPGESWPGWQFYASVEFNARNSWWRDFGALNEYVTRAQSFLQAGRPDQDVLLYYPLYESFATRGAALLKHFGGANPPPEGTVFERAATTLQQRGFTHDFISDRQLKTTRVAGGALVTSGGGIYKTVLVPASRFIPLETFEQLLALARSGATVVLLEGLPSDVSGLADLAKRRARFQSLREQIRFGPAGADGVREAKLGRGVMLTGDDLDRLLSRARVDRETLVDRGLDYVRRRDDHGRYYFIVNSSGRDVTEWIPLNDNARAAVVFDPMTGRSGTARSRRSSAGSQVTAAGRGLAEGPLEVEIMLPRGSSLVVATSDAPTGHRYPSLVASGPPVPIRGPWRVRFVSGGPDLPAEKTIDALASWTTFGGDPSTLREPQGRPEQGRGATGSGSSRARSQDDEFKRFSGTAVYSSTIPPLPSGAEAYEIDLGAVRESARVEIDGRLVGTLIGPSFRVTVDRSQLTGDATLAIHVTNLMANRIAALDKSGVRWKKFYNVNFPSRLPQNRGQDGLFSAAQWDPLDSGLLGPVTITPLTAR